MMLAIFAWNTALLPKDQRLAMINKFLMASFGSAPDDTFASAHQLVQELMERKLTHYAAIHRTIISFELTDRGADFHLSVVSTPEGSPP